MIIRTHVEPHREDQKEKQVVEHKDEFIVTQPVTTKKKNKKNTTTEEEISEFDKWLAKADEN